MNMQLYTPLAQPKSKVCFEQRQSLYLCRRTMLSSVLDHRKRVLAVKMGIEAFEKSLVSMTDPLRKQAVEAALVPMRQGLQAVYKDLEEAEEMLKKEKEWQAIEKTLCWCQGVACTERRTVHFIAKEVTRFLSQPHTPWCSRCSDARESFQAAAHGNAKKQRKG